MSEPPAPDAPRPEPSPGSEASPAPPPGAAFEPLPLPLVPLPPPAPPKPYKAPHPRRVPVESTLPWYVRLGLPLLVLLLAFQVYHADLEKPSIIDFDEAHYVKVARNFTRGVMIDPAWAEPRPQNFEHPPLGKYIIALGIYANGKPNNDMENSAYLRMCNFDNPVCARDAYAWRIGSAWTGAFGVLGMYWLGLRLFNRVSAGLFASFLLFTDGFYYIHARLAMLDIYPVAFALLAFGVGLGRTSAHRWMGAVLFGCAIGSKFSALFLMAPFVLLQFLVSPQTSRWMRLRDALIKGVIVPVVVFLALFAPFWKIWYDLRGGGWEGIKYALDTFVFVEKGAFTWTYGANAQHPYTSEPHTWIAMTRPVFFYVATLPNTDVGHIYAIGNPFLWWTASAAIVIFWLRAIPRFFITERIDWRFGAFWDWTRRPFAFRRDTALWFATLLFACAYGGYFFLKRDPFNFYFLTASPYFSLVAAGLVSEAWHRSPGWRLVSILYGALSFVTYVFYFPIYSGVYIKQRHFDYIYNLIRWMRR